jgi:hypothetical protein
MLTTQIEQNCPSSRRRQCTLTTQIEQDCPSSRRRRCTLTTQIEPNFVQPVDADNSN